MQNNASSYGLKHFRATHRLAIPVVIASICGLAATSAQAQTTIIQDFESFADTAALNAVISSPTANATITLGATSGVSGSQALIFQGNNGASPFYTQFTLNMTPFSLSGLSDVTLAVQGIGNTGSRENFKVELLNAGSTIAQGPQVNTQTFSTTSFDTYAISFSGLTDTIDALRFTFGPIDYGNTSVTLDNISTVAVPEPTSFALTGLGIAVLLLRKRQK